MCSRMFVALVFLAVAAQSADAGVVAGQGRGLEGERIPNVTMTIIRAEDGAVLLRRTFAGGNFGAKIADTLFSKDDKSISVIFSSPGREDARVDNLLGTGSVSGLDVILPLKLREPGPPSTCKSTKKCCSRRCYRKCRRFARCH